MGELYCDDFVWEQGFGSTEKYISYWFDRLKSPRFQGVDYYLDLFCEDLIVKGDVVSARGRKMSRRCYEVAEDGNLINTLWRVYPVDKRIYVPEEVFSNKRISRHWIVSDFVSFKRRFDRWVGADRLLRG